MTFPSKTTPYQLTAPLLIDGKQTTQLEVRRPTVRDNLIASQEEGDLAKEIKMLALLCGIDDDTIKDLDMADFEGVQHIVMGFRKPPQAASTPAT